MEAKGQPTFFVIISYHYEHQLGHKGELAGEACCFLLIGPIDVAEFKIHYNILVKKQKVRAMNLQPRADCHFNILTCGELQKLVSKPQLKVYEFLWYLQDDALKVNVILGFPNCCEGKLPFRPRIMIHAFNKTQFLDLEKRTNWAGCWSRGITLISPPQEIKPNALQIRMHAKEARGNLFNISVPLSTFILFPAPRREFASRVIGA
jgi:hypothetical protein